MLVLGIAVGVVYVGFLIAAVLLAIRWSIKRMNARTQKLGEALASAGGTRLGEAAGGFGKGTEVEFDFAGARVWASSYPVSRDFVRVNLRAPTPTTLPHVQVHKERTYDRLGKALQLNREVQVGDSDFDQAAYLHTRDADEPVQRAFSDPQVRADVLALLALGYRVELSHRGVEAYQVVLALRATNTETTAQAAQLIARICAQMPAFDASQLRPPQKPSSPKQVVTVIAFFIGIGAVGGVMSSTGGTSDLEGVATALLIGLASYVLFALVAFTWLRGRSNSLTLILLTLGFGSVGVPTIVTSGLLACNQVFDQSAAEPSEVVVTGKSKKGSDLYAGERHFAATYALYREVASGDRVIVNSRAGALGWRWTERVTRKALAPR